MQPTAANPHLLVFYITAIMTAKATANEQELQGASSGHSADGGGGNDAADAGDTT